MELRELAVRRAGIYAPGGRAAYPSTVLMCAVPARVAGVAEVVVATPGSDVILAACALCGVQEVYVVGGAQAIAALAHGTEAIEAVDVIVGPGNAYVQEAKRQVVGTVGIDGIEGPSELFVVADEEAEAAVVALDLAAQGEHGDETLLVLASPSSELLDAVEAEAGRLSERPSASNAPLALVRTTSLEAAVALSNEIAPEHLELNVARSRCAGAAGALGRMRVPGPQRRCGLRGLRGRLEPRAPHGRRRALRRTARREHVSAPAGVGIVARRGGTTARAARREHRARGRLPHSRRVGRGET